MIIEPSSLAIPKRKYCPYTPEVKDIFNRVTRKESMTKRMNKMYSYSQILFNSETDELHKCGLDMVCPSKVHVLET
jgi:hypothetical protein